MDHPAEAMGRLIPGRVVRVYPDTWQVDIRLDYGSSAIVPRCYVISHFLPEVHRPDRPSKVLVGWSDDYVQGPVAIPVHNILIPDTDKRDHVFWLRLFRWRIKIKQPGRDPNGPTAPLTGELEISNDNAPLQIRMQEEDGVIRLDTPSTWVVLKEADKSAEFHCDGDATVDAGRDLTATAGGDASIEANGNLTAKASGAATVEAGGALTLKGASVAIEGPVTITGDVAVTGAIAATGDIMDGAHNSNHHSHG